MLWSTYWTDNSVLTAGRPRASNSSMARVPVASWSRVWSIRRPISSPGDKSPSTRWPLSIFWVRFFFRAVTEIPPLDENLLVDFGQAVAAGHDHRFLQILGKKFRLKADPFHPTADGRTNKFPASHHKVCPQGEHFD